MSKDKVKKGSWKPKATYTAGLKVTALLEKPERLSAFAKKKVTADEVAELKAKSEQLRDEVRAKGQTLAGQKAATDSLHKACATAADYVGKVREALKRAEVSKAARKLAGIGKQVDPQSSEKVLKAINALLDAAANVEVGPELEAAGVDEDELTKLRAHAQEIGRLDTTQEQKKGDRKERGVDRRSVQCEVQQGVNRFFGLAHLVYADVPASLKLFTDCLPRSAGGTGDEVAEEIEA